MIIAEVGSNHNGDLETAFRLIDIAAECGADVVKFQSFLADQLFAADEPHYERLKKLELPRAWYPELMNRCRSGGVKFLSTATNETTLGWMEELGAEAYKVASGNVSHRPLIERLIDIGKPVIVSTGLAELDEIVALERRFAERGLREFAFLHCVSRYPASVAELNLGNIPALRQALSCPIGFSDHSLGTEGAIAAVALGARIVEKHISIDRTGLGMDHEVAATPDVFAAMCSGIRGIERALGASFAPDPATKFSMRRSLRFVRAMKKGELIARDDLKITRPEDGMRPEMLAEVVGRHLSCDVAADQPVRPGILLAAVT